MSYLPDIAVYSPDGRPQVVVVVKGLADKSPDWAASYRHNLLSDPPAVAAPYFVLALPDHLYVWGGGRDPAPRRPDLDLNAALVLQPYLLHQENGHPRWREGELQIVLTNWLDDLVRTDFGTPAPWAADLERIGLLPAVRGGEVRVGVAA